MDTATVAMGLIVLAIIGFTLACVNGYLARRYRIRIGDGRAPDAAYFFIFYGAVLIIVFVLIPLLVFTDIRVHTFVEYAFIITSIPLVGHAAGSGLARLYEGFWLPRAEKLFTIALNLGLRFARWFDRTIGTNEGRSPWRR